MRHFQAPSLLLFATAPSLILGDYFYYGSGCSGNRVLVNIAKYYSCYSLGSGYANSIYAVQGATYDQHIGFQPSSVNPTCGYGTCTASHINTCCSSSKKNIKALALYPTCTKSCSKEGIMASGEEGNLPLPLGGEDECVSTSNVGEVEIELSDGTYFGLGVGAPPPKLDDLKRDLAAAGKPALTEAMIAQLKEDSLIQ